MGKRPKQDEKLKAKRARDHLKVLAAPDEKEHSQEPRDWATRIT